MENARHLEFLKKRISNEIFSDFGPPYCWKNTPYEKKFEHIYGLLEVANATQQIYLGLPSWEDEWFKKFEERRKKFQAKMESKKQPQVVA